VRVVILAAIAGCSRADIPTQVDPRPGPVIAAVSPPTPVVAVASPHPPVDRQPRYAATHILIAWAGAARAPANLSRTEADARAMALDVLADAR
jgi:hypothetical protein